MLSRSAYALWGLGMAILAVVARPPDHLQRLDAEPSGPDPGGGGRQCADTGRTPAPSPDRFGLSFHHPMLDTSQGFIPGIVYTVRIFSREPEKFHISGFVVRSQVADKGYGRFVELNDAVKPCDDSGSAIQYLGDRWRSFAEVRWIGDAGARGTCIHFLASIKSNTEWTKIITTICLREDCYIIIASHYGTIDQETISTNGCLHTYIIFQRPLEDQIFLQFRELNLPTDGDDENCTLEYLEVYTGVVDAPIPRLCGLHFDNDMKYLGFQSENNLLIVKSKLSQNSSFRAVYYTLDKRKGCNDTFSSSEGHISSPNFPDFYFPNLDCYMVVVVIPGQKVSLHVKTLQIQADHPIMEDSSCTQDFLEIIVGNTTIRRLCGETEDFSPSELEVTSDRDVLLHFKSDFSRENRGFEVEYRLTKACRNETLTEANGTFFAAPTNATGVRVARNCYVVVHVPLGFLVEVNVTGANNKSDVNCTGVAAVSSLVEIIENDMVWVKCVDSEADAASFMSSGNSLAVRLVTRPPSRGITATYRAVPANASVLECDYGWVAGEHYCYALESDAQPWEEAEEICQAKGGHLASVGSNHVQNLLEEIIKTSLIFSDDIALWIGGNDRVYENCYEWSNGRPFGYTNWFSGWPQNNFYKSQPSDDGLANEDCIEMRRNYRYAAKGEGLTDHFYWNDRDCRVANPFICEKLKPGVMLDPYPPDCNRSISLSADKVRDVLTSPGRPDPYPHNVECFTVIHAPPGFRLVLTFSAFHLEDDVNCQFDYLEISEPSGQSVRHCGDWSGRLKLLRYESVGHVLHVLFVADYSHSFIGYKAEVALDQGRDQCDDGRLHPFNNYCYLFVSYPEVTWQTAHQICSEIQGHLASVWSQPEQNFIIERIKRMEAYSSGTIYWLGGFRRAITDTWQWVDASAFNYTDWYPGWVAEKNDGVYGSHHLLETEEACLAAQWKSIKDISGRLKYSGLYWSSHGCEYNGGYICKKKKLVISENLNRTFRGAAGSLASPNFPLSYANNLRYTVHIVGPPRTRILFQVTKLDMEWQEDCLYDFVGLQSTPEGPITRFCGLNTIDPYRLDFVSESNHLYVTFQSDYSITGAGFEAQWKAVDISGCPTVLNNVQSGTLQSVNYPDIYIHSLDCDATVRVPEGKRVWLEFRRFEVGTPPTGAKNECEDDYVHVILNHDRKVTLCGNLTEKLPELKFLTYGNHLQLKFHSDTKIAHTGYFATFRAVDRLEETAVVPLRPNMTDEMHGMNFPLLSPPAINLTRHLSAPFGHVIELKFPQSKLIRGSANDTCTHGKVHLTDPYKPENPKGWTLCNADPTNAMAEEYVFRSYLNSFYLTEITSPTAEYRAFTTSYSVVLDPEFDNKTLAVAFITSVDSCNPNPCINQAKCVETDERAVCRCTKHFAGLFCHMTKCESDPCMYGTCNLTETDYVCICDKGYGGRHCEDRLTPCASNPCGPRGKCVNQNDTFSCICHVWWEGPRCEKRIFKIPYRPLSQRMLEEPFWLGLITVSIVLLVLGCVWCIKRKFADKLERFLAEEIERSKQQREQHRARSPSVQKLNKLGVGVGVRERSSPVQASPPQGPRSLFSRLGRRKHSMLNLGAAAAPAYQENRSFSFDDLLRKGPSRLPNRGGASSGGGGGGGGATTGGFGATVAPEEETREILRSLVTPATKSRERRMSIEEFIQLSERKIKEAVHDGGQGEATGATGTEVRSGEGEMRETSFLTPPRPHKSLKKKVSFAKFVETAAESLAAASRQMAMSSSLSAPEDPFQPPNPVLNSRPSCAIEVSPPDSEQVSQATKSDTEDVTSGDDVSIEVPVFSSSSSSPETPARSLQGRLNGGDSTPSSPVVVVHQPPPSKDSPRKCLGSLSKLVISMSENEQEYKSDEDELGEEEDEDEDEGLIMVVGKTRESRAAVPETPPTAVGEEQEDEEGVVIPTKEETSSVHQDPNDSTTVFRCLETLSPDNPLQKLALDSPLEHSHSLMGGNLLSPPKDMILQKAGKKVELPESKSLQLDRVAAEVKKSTELRLSENKQTPHLIAEELAKVKGLAPEKDNPNKVHAIDDLAEALEKKRLRELLSPQPIQIPIFSMYDSRWPYQRKSSLDAAMLRVPDSFQKKPEMSHLTLPPLGTPLSALAPGMKGTYGIPLHPTPTKLTASPPFQRKSPQLVPGFHGEMDAVRLKGKPPPLQIPKLLLESPPRRRVKGVDKPNSLDIPAPVITITSNMSSCDSDTDSPIKAVGASGNMHASAHYLTPFVMLCPTEDMSTSMSNLSSSGYSSMASPGPSRCGSNNPLCPSSENEQDPPTPRQMANKPFMKAGFLCPPSTSMFQPRARLLSGDRTPSSREVSPPSGKTSPAIRKRSDSETTDEPPGPSVSIDDSNEDEGIGMEGGVFREPEHRQNSNMGLRVLRMDPKSPPPPFFTTSSPTMRVGMAVMNESIHIPERDTGPSPMFLLIPASPKCELAPPVTEASTSATPPPPSDPVPPPVIVVQEGSDSDASANDVWRSVRRKSFERKLSPVSSRSESPLSDRGQASLEHFSPQFYGNSDAVGGVIYTDSDGLYDCPSSEVAPPSITKPVNKRQSRRRERHQVRHKTLPATASGPPNLPVAPRHKQVAELAKERLITARRTSPKRRTRAPVAKDADSSSSDSSSTSASAQDQLLVHRSPTPDQSTREPTGLSETRSPIRASHRRKGGYNRADTTPIYPRREFKKSDSSLSVRDTAGSSDCGSSRSGGGRHDASSSGSSCNSRDSKITVKHIEIDDSLRASGRRGDGRNPVARVFRRFGPSNKRDSLESPIESTDSDPDSHTTLVSADVHRPNGTSGEAGKRSISISNRKIPLPPLGSMEEEDEQRTGLLSVTVSREASGEDSHATSCDEDETDLV